MKNKMLGIYLLMSLLLLVLFQSCSDTPVNSPMHENGTGTLKPKELSQTNLVSDISTFNPHIIDPNLVNAWGMSITPNGRFWISSNENSLTVIYNDTGATVLAPVQIPGTSGFNGVPSGQIFNPTTDFKISGTPAKFIFVGEDGIVSAWVSGPSAVIAANRSSENSVYKGITMGVRNGMNCLFLCDFHNSKIDILDAEFHIINQNGFQDPLIPEHWGPFNAANIDGMIYVTYAKQKPPDFHDDLAGPANGFVDVFSPNGAFVKRLAMRGILNSPWGIAVTTPEFDGGGNILIGNFGDGRINVFSHDGIIMGQLRGPDNKLLTIDGLWALGFKSSGAGLDRLYFTAGPNEESHGLFGYLK